MNKTTKNVRVALKQIPSIDEILKKFPLKSIPLDFYKYHINLTLNEIRLEITKGKKIIDINDHCLKNVKLLKKKLLPNSLKEVINGTGIILHTGLGRAPISKDILIDGIIKNYPYSNLELNLLTGKRDDRNKHISSLLNSLCKTEKTLIVNNNAAAVILMLNSICQNKEVIISRGQLVEIGGSFRIPDIILKSNCKIVEVGTTNKTHLSDYENAISPNTSSILYVHTSNYKIIGFANEIEIKKLAKLAKKYNIPLLVDLGSGTFADFKELGLPFEEIISKYIKSGVDVLTFSGDKLLGGPQAGIITGKKELLNKIFKNPLYRAFRFDKIRLSIMETVLRTYYSDKIIADKNLTIKLFKRNQTDLIKLAKIIISSINTNKYEIKYKKSNVEAGSGSLPTKSIPSIALTINSKNIKTTTLYKNFLGALIPVIGYIKDDIYHIDLKAIPDDQIKTLIKSIIEILS